MGIKPTTFGRPLADRGHSKIWARTGRCAKCPPASSDRLQHGPCVHAPGLYAQTWAWCISCMPGSFIQSKFSEMDSVCARVRVCLCVRIRA